MELEQAFYCRDGKVVKNLEDLSQSLKEMNDDEFSHHVNQYKNDFAVWISNVLKDEELTSKVKPCLTKQDVLLVIDEKLMRVQVSEKVQELKGKENSNPKVIQDSSGAGSDVIATPEVTATTEPNPMPETQQSTDDEQLSEASKLESESKNEITEPPDIVDVKQSESKISEEEKNLLEQEKISGSGGSHGFHELKKEDKTIIANDVSKDINQAIQAHDEPVEDKNVDSKPADSKSSSSIHVDNKPIEKKESHSTNDKSSDNTLAKKNDPRYFSLKEFMMGLLMAFVIGFVVCGVVMKLLGW
ncbi:MAG: hypothetical protein KKG59_07925 [Nanoarchaeota archaeon]|nr:hypothetical protein [Nanoarchaeota archaeon]